MLLSVVIVGCGDGSSLSASSQPSDESTSLRSTSSGSTSPTSTTSIDSCLIGDWRLTGTTDPSVTGGGGTIVSIRPDGTATLDYSASSPFVSPSGTTVSFTGVGNFTILFANAGRMLIRPDDSTIARTENGGTPITGRGNAGSFTAYACSANTITLSNPNGGFVFSH